MDKNINIRISTSEASTTTTVEANAPLKPQIKGVVARIEKEIIKGTLIKYRWNLGVVARVLEISYRSLLYKMKEYNLRSKELTNE